MNDDAVSEAAAFDLALPVAVLFALIPFDPPPEPDPDRDPAAVFFDAF